MKELLTRLDAILDGLAKPEDLTAEAVGLLAQEWDALMGRLEQLPESAAYQALSPGDKLYLRVWLQRILDRLPAVQGGLSAHKSDIARQLFSENRRFQAINSRYSAEFHGSSQLHQKA
ncbi:MAG: hypothetical protein H7836_03790 [Magnetococcus sp. YQC-3]